MEGEGDQGLGVIGGLVYRPVGVIGQGSLASACAIANQWIYISTRNVKAKLDKVLTIRFLQMTGIGDERLRVAYGRR